MDGHNILVKQSYKQYEQLFNQGYSSVTEYQTKSESMWRVTLRIFFSFSFCQFFFCVIMVNPEPSLPPPYFAELQYEPAADGEPQLTAEDRLSHRSVTHTVIKSHTKISIGQSHIDCTDTAERYCSCSTTQSHKTLINTNTNHTISLQSTLVLYF